MAENKVIQLHFPLDAVVSYAKKWHEQAMKETDLSDAEKAMCEDMLAVIEVGAGVMIESKSTPQKS